jgi:hypothetical protein
VKERADGRPKVFTKRLFNALLNVGAINANETHRMLTRNLPPRAHPPGLTEACAELREAERERDEAQARKEKRRRLAKRSARQDRRKKLRRSPRKARGRKKRRSL